MALRVDELRELAGATSKAAWQSIISRAVQTCSAPLSAATAPSEVTRRDREIGTLDHFLAAGGWDLWKRFGQDVERTSDRLARWWTEPYSAKAVLILDGLSLRELPWLLAGAQERELCANLGDGGLRRRRIVAGVQPARTSRGAIRREERYNRYLPASAEIV